MHVPLFVTSHLDFEKKIQNRYTLMQKYGHLVKAARFILTPINDDFNFSQCFVSDIDDCENNPCVKEACIDKTNSYTCLCEEEFAGYNCNGKEL